MSDERPTGQQQNRFYGDYIGVVESVDDPDKILRAQVRVFGIFTDKVPKKDLPWAEYLLPVGSRINDGCFTPVSVDDYVWVKFPFDGDSRRPMITGSVHHAPGKIPSFPHESFAGSGKLVHKTTGEEPTPAAAQYHKNVVYTQNGVTFEINTDHSFVITQRATGTSIRVSPSGDITLHSEASTFLSTIGHLKAVIEGNLKVDVTGKTEITSMEGVNIDGGAGDLSGVVTKDCICPFTGQPHSDFSLDVQASKG